MFSSPDNLSLRPEDADPHLSREEFALTRWQKFRLVVKVVELRLRFVALMAVTGLVFTYWDTLANYYEKWTRPPGEQVAAAHGLEYYCPMHPSVVQEKPGNCPICGMPLSKRKQGEKTALPEGVVSRLQLAPFRIAQAGIRTADVSYSPLSERLTTVGSVGFDERRLARISSKLKGMTRVEKLAVNFNGTPVNAGDVLAEVYNPELAQTVRELLLAQERSGEASAATSALGRSLLGGQDLVRLATDKLLLWGITRQQVDEILRTGKTGDRMPIVAPISGVVVRKNVVEGQYVAEGDSLFEIADLSHVWILAQVYEDQVGQVRDGQAVEATVEAYPGELFKGRVAFRDPALNPATRTLGVRYDLENPEGRLQPGMFATVTITTPLAETPAFRARLASARPSASHVGHAESLTVDEQEFCPVTKAKLGSMGKPITVQLASRKVWVCCSGCPEKLKAQPAKFLEGMESQPAEGVLSVPETAVIDTGDRKIVYVEAQPGVFEGRQVVLGPRIGERFPVLEGLAANEKVAAAGAFLIDAETRLNQGAAAATSEPAPQSADRSTSSAPATGVTHRH
ncbi:MAG: efflux RND transporter periplasmic adaptor subunit [Planctomycetaceae bacterium]|nr:efflux RND transporter periplasmic adaptor subunit [Planctomycetaceae bacterium]